VRVRVDPERCQGHNRCRQLAPELFEVDAQGYAHERNDGRVTAPLEGKARRAAANCPEGAITLEEDT
jgi:ferredoxin